MTPRAPPYRRAGGCKALRRLCRQTRAAATERGARSGPREGQRPREPGPGDSRRAAKMRGPSFPNPARLPPPTRAAGGSCWRPRRKARSRPASARFLPTLATPLPGRRRWGTSCATPAGRRTREGRRVSPQLDGKKGVTNN